MKIKKLSLLLCVVALMFCFSAGLMAADVITHDISQGNIEINACEGDCPGHVISGSVVLEDNNIRVLSGDHKITLAEGLMIVNSFPDETTTIDPELHSALYIADGVNKVEITVNGNVNFTGWYGIYSNAMELTINGDENSGLDISGKHISVYSSNNINLNGGTYRFSTNPIDNGFIPFQGEAYCRGLKVGGTLAVTDVSQLKVAILSVKNYRSGEENAIVSCGIEAKELLISGTKEVIVENQSVVPAEGIGEDVEYKNIGIYADDMKVTSSGLYVFAGMGSHSYGIQSNDMCGVVDSKILVSAAEADVDSYGINSYGDFEVVNSQINMNGDTSGDMSAGGWFEKLVVVDDSKVNGIAGKAKYQSDGIAGIQLIADGSFVYGRGGTVTGDEDTSGYSEGLFFTYIDAIDSEIIGKGETDGIWVSQVYLEGGVIRGIGSADSEESYGITLWVDDLDEDKAPIYPKFELIGANVVAEGATQGISWVIDSEYKDDVTTQIIYKEDKNAEAEVITEFDGENFSYGKTYEVIYDANGVDARNMPANEAYFNGEEFLLSKKVPVADGYEFICWSENPWGLGLCYDPEKDIPLVMNDKGYKLYAIWDCLGKEPCILNTFDDLDPAMWYHDGIEYCLKTNLLKGMSKTAFEPGTATTRAMIITTLYRLAGTPEVESKAAFTDVKDGTWYADAVAWAEEIGIAEGYEDGTFAPNKVATREEVAVFFHRYSPYFSEEFVIPETYVDKDEVSTWAVNAMGWAVKFGVINGMSEDTLAPKATSNRAQLAQMLYRYEIPVLN